MLPGADPNGDESGSSYVIFGRSDFGGGGEVIEGTPGNDKLTGTPAAEVFEAGDGNDRMIGRGGADVFHGDAGDDYIQVADLGFGLVDGGSGNDVLYTEGKDLNLNLADFSDKIHRQVLSDQQHRISLGIAVIKTVAAAIHPTAILHGEQISGIAMHFQGICAIR